MTVKGSANLAAAPDGALASRPLARRLLLVGAPLLLGIALGFHPHGGEDLYGALEPVADAWALYHVLLLPLFGLLGVCLYVLLDGYAGTVATVGRIGVAVYFVFYVAFEAIAGIATGLLVREARTLPAEQQAGVAAALEALTEPIFVLALLGTAGAIVATVSIAVLLLQSGAPTVPVVLLAGLPVGVFAHSGAPLDAVAMALFALGIGWLELGWDGTDGRRSDGTS